MCFLSTTFPNAPAHPPLYFLTGPLPKNGRLGLGLVSNMALKKRNHESPFGTFRPEKQDYLFTVLVCFQMFRYSQKFSAGTTQNGVSHLVSNRISGNFLQMVNNQSYILCGVVPWELKQRRRWRERGRQKNSRFRLANNRYSLLEFISRKKKSQTFDKLNEME